MRLSLRTRLLLVPVVVVAGAVALFTGLEHRSQRRWLVAREGESLLRLTHELARTAAPLAGSWQAAADSLDARSGLRTTVIAADGRVLADSRARAASMDNHAGRAEVGAALAGRPAFAVRRSATVGVEFLYGAVPMRRDSAAVLRLGEPLVVVQRLADSLTRLSVAASLLALAASIAALLYVSGRLARRLRALQDLARRIGRGDPGARAPEAPGDELGQLGRALNEMRAELDLRHEVLRRERDDRERILAHMTDGVALLDGADRVVHVNHRFAELLGEPRRPLAGTPFTSFSRIPEMLELAAEARREGRTAERTLRAWSTRTGSVLAGATPLGGSPAPVLLVLHDLSPEEALQRMRQDFVANVSHELRTPLTSLRGYAETLLEGGLDDAENRERFVRVIRDGAVRLQALVEDLLALAELERPEASLRRESLDLRALAAEHVSLAQDAARRAGLVLELEPGAPVPLAADRLRLGQVFANLLDNAVKYTASGGVRVAVGRDDGRAWCEVRDTGRGIPAEDLPRVFERFYRVDKSRVRGADGGEGRGAGTGLGLAIVKHALALHGGDVSVRSRVGGGSVFRFELPVAPPPGERSAQG